MKEGVRLKFIVVLALFSVMSLGAHSKVDSFTCHGPDVRPTARQKAKIEKSLSLFSRQPKIVKPKFLIRKAGSMCHNAWADPLNNRVVLARPSVEDFSAEELTGLIAHEIAHLESPQETAHWKTDLRGAELTSKKIMILEFMKMRAISSSMKSMDTKNWDSYEWQISDYNFRIDKVLGY